MRSLLAPSLFGLGALVMATGAEAQSSIRPGQTIEGRLSAQDSKLEDGSYYQCFTLNTVADRVYVLTLKSGDFDAFLSAGPGRNCQDVENGNDDGPDMGTDSQLTVPSTGGVWTIRANALSADETGAFTLSVTEGEAITPSREIQDLTLGASVAGTLSYGDRRAEDGSLYDCYRFQMRSDDTVALRMDASDLDAFMGLYPGDQCEGVPLTTDDDSGGGTSAQIVERLKAGAYSVRANSLGAGATGAYSLSLTVRR